MSTDVPPEFESFVSSLIARRRFLSEHEVLSEGLRLLQARESLAEEVQRGAIKLKADSVSTDLRRSRSCETASQAKVSHRHASYLRVVK